MTWVGKPTRSERWRAEVDEWVEAGDARAGVGGQCGAPRRKHNDPGQGPCEQPAGYGTPHLGTGHCAQHGGNSKRENARGAWVLAHEMARALNVTPWEALLGEVRRTAGTVAWLDRKVAEAPDDDALLSTAPPDPEAGTPGGYRRWVDMRLEERRHLARVSKMAVDAGVAQQLVAQFALQGETVARVLTAVLAQLGLSLDQEEHADELLRRELLKLESTATEDRAIEGEVVKVERRR
jgi:hypothetical protein